MLHRPCDKVESGFTAGEWQIEGELQQSWQNQDRTGQNQDEIRAVLWQSWQVIGTTMQALQVESDGP